MNRVIHRELTASELPESLRGDIDPTHRVRVRVEDIGRSPSKRMLEAERILKLAGISKHKNTSPAEAAAKIRKIRNEWE